MTAVEMIVRLTDLVKLHGDKEVLIDTGSELESIEEIDVDVDDNGIVIWPG